MAEATFGVMQGMKNTILLTLGTGVGGGLPLDGKLHQGLAQMAGHIGHSTIQSGSDELSILGIPRSLEYSIGNYSISKRSQGTFQSTYELLEAYKKGDTFATWMWLDMMRTLALSICSLTNIFSPEAVVLSGGLTHAGNVLFDPLQDFIDRYEFRPWGKQTKILKAHFEDFLGLLVPQLLLSKNLKPTRKQENHVLYSNLSRSLSRTFRLHSNSRINYSNCGRLVFKIHTCWSNGSRLWFRT